MPTLNWMGRETATKSVKDVVMKILREDKSLSYHADELLSLRGVSEFRSSEGNSKNSSSLQNSKTPNSESNSKSTVLGIHDGVAYALLYNGILKDRSVNGGNVLTRKTLEVIQADLAGLEHERIVVYGEACRLMAPTLEALKIEFRQTPYDLVTRR